MSPQVKTKAKHTFFATQFLNPDFSLPAMDQFWINPDRLLDNAQKVFKADATSTVGLITLNDQQFVLKRSNKRGIFRACKRAFVPSRAHRSWHNAQRLAEINIPTFTPVAMIEKRFGFLRGNSYLLTSVIEGIDALHYFAKGAKPQADWEIIAQRILALIKKLADHNITHRDLNLSNIILQHGEPYLIDLDAMCFHDHPLPPKVKLKDQQRFMQNWHEWEGTGAARLIFEKLL